MTATQWGRKSTAARGIGSIAAAFALALFSTGTVAAQASHTNTKYGTGALLSNTAGYINSAFGYNALRSNTSGFANTASGYHALFSNTTGDNNTASGVSALSHNDGNNNTASGAQALVRNTTGHDNIGVGYFAGQYITTGSNNIDIGPGGTVDESYTIRIGTQGTQTQTFIAGISSTGVTGADVVVASDGQLGVPLSSARFKRDIRDMAGASTRLMELRPVTFRYKQDHTGTVQYGLVAEEVARVYPELVTYGADGKVETVRYSELTGMLLNELQKQNAQLHAQQREIAELKADRDRERAQRTAFEARLLALEQTTEARNGGGKLAAAFNH